MAYLTYTGANTGSPNSVDMKPPSGLTAQQKETFTAGALVVGQSGCLACHTLGGNGNSGPGPNLTHIGAKLPAAVGAERDEGDGFVLLEAAERLLQGAIDSIRERTPE